MVAPFAQIGLQRGRERGHLPTGKNIDLRCLLLFQAIVCILRYGCQYGRVTIHFQPDENAGRQAMRDRTLATWVARNVLVQYQLDAAWPEVGERKGTMEMGRREWRWRMNISQTEEEALRRMDVEVVPVEAEDEETLAILSGFLREPDS